MEPIPDTSEIGFIVQCGQGLSQEKNVKVIFLHSNSTTIADIEDQPVIMQMKGQSILIHATTMGISQKGLLFHLDYYRNIIYAVHTHIRKKIPYPYRRHLLGVHTVRHKLVN